MTYDVLLPISGFEIFPKATLTKDDEFFATLSFESEGLELRLINIIPLQETIEIADNFLQLLNVKSQKDIEIYSIVVLQNPIESSIINLYAPLVFNTKTKEVGQVVNGVQGIGFEPLSAFM